jgi:hypothetical protein
MIFILDETLMFLPSPTNGRGVGGEGMLPAKLKSSPLPNPLPQAGEGTHALGVLK